MGKELYPARILIVTTDEQKEKLQKIAKNESISMNQLIRNALDLIIKKYDKKG